MDWFCWTASLDSLIVGIALSAVVGQWHIVPLAALFGICDAAGSWVGQALRSPFPLAWLVPVVLVLCGATIFLDRQNFAWRRRIGHGAYLLPPLMATDNLLTPTQYPATAGCISSAMAILGFALGLAITRRLAGHALSARLPGVPLIASGLLLAV